MRQEQFKTRVVHEHGSHSRLLRSFSVSTDRGEAKQIREWCEHVSHFGSRVTDNGFAGLTFLDIGCGSGHRILDIAKTFPNARFVGFDISGKNIELAKDQAKLDQVTNITFTQCGIDDYEAP